MTDYQRRMVDRAVLETGGPRYFAVELPLGTKQNPGMFIDAIGALLNEWLTKRGEAKMYAVSVGHEGTPLLVETPDEVIEIVSTYARGIMYWSGTSFRVFVS